MACADSPIVRRRYASAANSQQVRSVFLETIGFHRFYFIAQVEAR
jgi:hypothetical protein